jgi:hypothetical protein
VVFHHFKRIPSRSQSLKVTQSHLSKRIVVNHNHDSTAHHTLIQFSQMFIYNVVFIRGSASWFDLIRRRDSQSSAKPHVIGARELQACPMWRRHICEEKRTRENEKLSMNIKSLTKFCRNSCCYAFTLCSRSCLNNRKFMNLVRTSKRTKHLTVTKTIWLMLRK